MSIERSQPETTVDETLLQALEAAEDDEARYQLRQALQLRVAERRET